MKSSIHRHHVLKSEITASTSFSRSSVSSTPVSQSVNSRCSSRRRRCETTLLGLRHRVQRLPRLACCYLGLLVGLSGCGQPTGPQRFPVTGIVHVNGSPAERVAVLFQHHDQSIPSSYRYPTGVTNAEGVFQLSSTGHNDGAVPGKYSVTFNWLSSGELDAFDMFNGAFSQAAQSEHQVEIPVATDEPLVLRLSIPESRIRRSRATRPEN